MSHLIVSSLAYVASNSLARGLVAYLKPSADTGLRLSAYTTSTQRGPSHDFHVQLVPPGVCPGVMRAITISEPTFKICPWRTTSTFFTRSIGGRMPYCG